MHVYMYIYIYIYIYIYTPIHIYVCVCICVYVCVYVYVYISGYNTFTYMMLLPKDGPPDLSRFGLSSAQPKDLLIQVGGIHIHTQYKGLPVCLYVCVCV